MGTEENVAQDDLNLAPENTDTPISYTPEQLQKAIEKATRDARTAVMAEAGRVRSEGEKSLQKAQEALVRMEKIQQEQEEAELREAQDEPDALASIRVRHEARKLKADLESKSTELEMARNQLRELTDKEKEATKSSIAQKIAQSQSVNPTTLERLARFTDGSEEAIEAIARDLPKIQQTEGAVPRFMPDSNKSKGGASRDKYQVMKDYNSGNINAVQYAEQMRAMGLVP